MNICHHIYNRDPITYRISARLKFWHGNEVSDLLKQVGDDRILVKYVAQFQFFQSIWITFPEGIKMNTD